ncbi:MAG: hypothetical protein AAFY34_08830 [Pseudomonadota bacterium]
MSEETVGIRRKTLRGQADITDLTAVIAERKAQGEQAAQSRRSLSQRLLAGDAPRYGAHPADAVLRALDTKVEADARQEADAEIDALASEIKLVSAEETGRSVLEMVGRTPLPPHVLPQAAAILPTPEEVEDVTAGDDWTWLEDVALVAIAENGGEPIIAAKPDERPVVEAAAAAHLSDVINSDDIDPEFDEALPDPEPIRLFERQPRKNRQPEIIEDTAKPKAKARVPVPIPMQAPVQRTFFGLHPGSAFEERNKREGLPLWLHLGLPLAAVSAAALAIGIYNLTKPNASADAAIDRTPVDVSSTASARPSAPVAEISEVREEAAIPSANADAIADPVRPTRVADAAPSIAPEPLLDATIADDGRVTTRVQPARPGNVAPAPSAKPDSVPALIVTAPVPSVKPDIQIRVADVAGQTRAARRPNRQSAGIIPVRAFLGPAEAGSAASELIEIANLSSEVSLTATDAQLLAGDLEKAFDDEIDGRSISLRSTPGDWYRITFESSHQDIREYAFKRSRRVAPIPGNIVLERGWYAATTETQFRAEPSVQGDLIGAIIPPGTLLERMGTVTDAYGDRWYLIRSNGVAIGYLSPADLIIAELYEGELNAPLAIGSADAAIKETSRAYTQCRTATMGPEGGYWQVVASCRNPDGHWVHPASGYVPQDTLIANGGDAAILVAGAQLPVQAAGPIDRPEVRDHLNEALPYWPEGTPARRTLPDGESVTFTFGERFQTPRKVNLVRVDEVGPINRPVKVDTRWLHVPNGARLLSSPDYDTAMSVGELEAGRAVETLIRSSEGGEDWILVGRDGVGLGWVPEGQLASLTGSDPFTAIDTRPGSAVTVDEVIAEVPCRTVDYAAGSFVACQQTDGTWNVETVETNLIAATVATTIAATY